MPDKTLPVGANAKTLGLSPTDISQFIRLEQCERYLRLRLHERAYGREFMRDYGVQPQAVTPLLTRSGRVFEDQVEAAVRARYPVIHLAEEAADPAERSPDNARVAQAARDLPAGSVLVLFQARLRVLLEDWQLTGEADVVRLERSAGGALHILVADMKSTTTAKVEHRLQVAFYHAMLARILEAEGVACAEIRTGILYRGGTAVPGDVDEAAQADREREAGQVFFGVDALLELVADPQAYLESVQDLVTGPGSLARQVALAPFAEIPFHLTYKCDGYLYNEFCMKWCAEQDDLSLIPHLAASDKSALRKTGIMTIRELSSLKVLQDTELAPAPGREELCQRVATTWPVGPRVNELIHRARRYRKWKRDGTEALPFIPNKGHGSLPYCDAEQNPNLVRVYLDAQHDYLYDRIYMAGALVIASAEGVPVRRRAVVELTGGPPDSPERERDLLARWVTATLRAIVELAEPDEAGEPRAPVHLIFFNRFGQSLLLQGLSRHFTSILEEAPALYDFMTQLAAYDSPIATFLDEEIRERKNYPMVCQSLQAIATYLKFRWDEPEPYTRLFRERLFDYWGKLSGDPDEPDWYAARSRFNSQIPLEYAYAAWGELPLPAGGQRDDYAPFRAATGDLLKRFHVRRLEALERIAGDLPGNRLTEKRPFHLPDLAGFSDQARSLAEALDEFVTIERHVELDAWKTTRHAPPERRVLMGETLLARYEEAGQDPAAAAQNRENEERRRLQEEYRADFRLANPDAPKVKLPKDQKTASDWSQAGLRLRLRLDTEGLDCTLDEAMALCTLREGDRVVVYPRWTVDERLPIESRTPFTPTPRQMLYGTRADIVRLELTRDGAGKVVSGFVEIEFARSMSATNSRGFLFGSVDRPLRDGELYTLDSDPNNIYGFWCAKITEGLRALEEGRESGRSTLYERIAQPPGPPPVWPDAARAGQARFLAGLDALNAAGVLHAFEPSKREYIGEHGGAGILLVQGPPGTGKSYSTAFALFARMQGAMAAGREFRAFLSCKTHAATDVLLANVLGVQRQLQGIQREHPGLFAEYFDPRILAIPLYRVAPREAPPAGIAALRKDEEKTKGQPKNLTVLRGEQWCVVGATPGGIYGMLKNGKLFDTPVCDCLILDEASQMNLPEAAMAALPLRPEGTLVVVGDHRQMPPIVQHDWEAEPRRTFQEYRAYESLFLTLLPLDPPVIRFEESFRLHREMAEFLRREIYQQDGIRYFSRREQVLPSREIADSFAQAVLQPDHPIVVVVHDEAASQTRNPFEERLITPILEALADPARYALDSAEGLGVVVPHRAQRAALQLDVPCLSVVDLQTGTVVRSAVDTVERFQGGERTVIVVSATESDREYLLASSKFLLDPRRLTVAISRAKQKLVLVASRSVFALFSPHEETFANSQLWKNLLRRTCTVLLWEGEQEGQRVEVWGNQQAPPPERADGLPIGEEGL